MKLSPKNDFVRIAIVSFLILFTELLLIRLIGTEIRIFAYLSNIVLLAIFIGSGIGMFLKKKLSPLVTLKLIPLMAIVIVLGKLAKISDLLAPLNESFIWFEFVELNPFKIALFGFVGISLTLVIFVMLMLTFVPLGQYLGILFSKTKNIKIAYSVNIVFSLLGIWAFYGISFLSINPYLALMIAALLTLLLLEKTTRKKGIPYVAAIFCISISMLILKPNVTWSPYQKLELRNAPQAENLPKGKILLVNNVGYMGLFDFSHSYQTKTEQVIKKQIQEGNLPEDYVTFNQYDIPFLLHPNAKKVLIIGSGGGNDTAGALRAKIPQIDAVEIDPKIVEIGKKHHPENSYESDSITIFIDDGRSFLRQTNEKYDMVIMGLADSHTLNSNMTNVQLDNYLYTQESMQEIQTVLNDDGVFYISFEVSKPWIGSRISKNMSTAFGKQPIIFDLPNDLQINGRGGTVFAIRKTGDLMETLSNNEKLQKLVSERKLVYEDSQKQLTDDWPYLYLDQPRLPKIHFIISAILLGGFYFLAKKMNFSKSFNLSAFFLGAGFLLYEFQNIGRTSLLYGNTWVTNAFIISAILSLILVANLTSLKVKIPIKYLYIMLFATFALQFATPISYLNNFSQLIKYTLVPLFLNLPLLFSGLIFIQLFSKAKEKNSFFASNLIGSAVGGVLSFLSYLLGIKFLIIVSLGFYILSFFVVEKRSRGFVTKIQNKIDSVSRLLFNS